MKKIIALYVLLIIAFLALTSCKSAYNIKSNELTPLKKNFANSYLDFKLNIDSTSQLLNLFNVDAINSNRIVNVEILNDNELKLTYKNGFNVIESRIFNGKLKNNGFKIFIKKERWFILPIVWKTNVKRLKLNLDKNDNLVINEYSNNSGMFLFMAAGNTSKKQHLFKKVG
jgi:hypothetical protein